MSYEQDVDEILPEPVNFIVNGQHIRREVSPRQHLGDFLRTELGLFGTRLGCEQGVCGSCAVVVNGETIRGCLMLAAQMEGANVVTIEGCESNLIVRALQSAFISRNAMQCGFCTSGMILTAAELLSLNPDPNKEQVREYLSGNYCRCTGYQSIVEAVMMAAKNLKQGKPSP